MNLKNIIAQNLLQIKAIKLNPQNPFTWASGMRSPIYCDNRVSLSYPEVRTLIKKSLAEVATQLGATDMIAGVAAAGIAHGALLADELNLPFCYVRSNPKEHGRQNQIEGEIAPHSKILVVEDLISTGGSSIDVVKVLRSEGHDVVGVLAIFDYQFEIARQNFLNSQCIYRTLSDYSTLITEAVASHYISDAEAEMLSNWNSDPHQWYANSK